MESFLPLIILGIIIMEGALTSVMTGVIQGMGRFKALGLNMILSPAAESFSRITMIMKLTENFLRAGRSSKGSVLRMPSLIITK